MPTKKNRDKPAIGIWDFQLEKIKKKVILFCFLNVYIYEG